MSFAQETVGCLSTVSLLSLRLASWPLGLRSDISLPRGSREWPSPSFDTARRRLQDACARMRPFPLVSPSLHEL